jgi:hypothetical protein
MGYGVWRMGSFGKKTASGMVWEVDSDGALRLA